MESSYMLHIYKWKEISYSYLHLFSLALFNPGSSTNRMIEADYELL